MRLTQAQVFVHFQMQLDEELTVMLESRHVVNRQAHALRYCANGFE